MFRRFSRSALELDGSVGLVELAQRFGFIAAPHPHGNDTGYAALRPHGIAKVTATIGAQIGRCYRRSIAS